MTDWLALALALPSSPDAAAKPAEPAKPLLESPGEEVLGGFAGSAAQGPYPNERAAAPARDGPHAWRAALLALSPDHDPCPGSRPDAWARVLGNALDFLHLHGVEAKRLGWTDVELFGVHPVVGVIRVDHAGALMLSVGSWVESVETGAIRYSAGLTYRRSGVPAATVPVWAFGRSAIHLHQGAAA